jgi:hypothetical protein
MQRACAVLYCLSSVARLALPYFSTKSRKTWTSWPLKMGPILCPETSVQAYHSTLRNIPKERRPHPHRSRSLKSRKLTKLFSPCFLTRCHFEIEPLASQLENKRPPLFGHLVRLLSQGIEQYLQLISSALCPLVCTDLQRDHLGLDSTWIIQGTLRHFAVSLVVT